MNDRSRKAQGNVQPPDGIIVSASVVQTPPEPNADKTSNLMPKKYNTLQQSHVAGSKHDCNHSRSCRNCRQSQKTHAKSTKAFQEYP
jgi:hypothetical protein